MLDLFVSALKIMFLPGLAQGPCDIAYFDTKPFAVCTIGVSTHRLALVGGSLT